MATYNAESSVPPSANEANEATLLLPVLNGDYAVQAENQGDGEVEIMEQHQIVRRKYS